MTIGSLLGMSAADIDALLAVRAQQMSLGLPGVPSGVKLALGELEAAVDAMLEYHIRRSDQLGRTEHRYRRRTGRPVLVPAFATDEDLWQVRPQLYGISATRYATLIEHVQVYYADHQLQAIPMEISGEAHAQFCEQYLVPAEVSSQPAFLQFFAVHEYALGLWEHGWPNRRAAEPGWVRAMCEFHGVSTWWLANHLQLPAGSMRWVSEPVSPPEEVAAYLLGLGEFARNQMLATYTDFSARLAARGEPGALFLVGFTDDEDLARYLEHSIPMAASTHFVAVEQARLAIQAHGHEAVIVIIDAAAYDAWRGKKRSCPTQLVEWARTQLPRAADPWGRA